MTLNPTITGPHTDVQSAAKKHKSATCSKQRRACAACSRYVGTSRLGSLNGAYIHCYLLRPSSIEAHRCFPLPSQ